MAKNRATKVRFDDARHLLLRTGWGPEPAHIDALVGLTRQQAVRKLINGLRDAPHRPLPGWRRELPPPRREIRADKRAFKKKVRTMAKELRAWWLAEMITTPSPLTEKLTLFWHGHFTSSLRVVRWAPAMLQQNLLLRREGTRDFRALLRGVLRDPAMLRYLDNHQNRVGKPNENLAMHPELAPLRPLWRRGELAWVLGLGYDNPNRSHFKSGDIWCAADPQVRALEKGWLSRALYGHQVSGSPADGLLFGAAHAGPFTGGRGLVLRGDRRAVATRRWL